MTNTAKTGPPVSFRASPDLQDELRARGAPGPTARRDLQRYYELLREALAGVSFTLEQARLLARLVEPLVRAEPFPGIHRYLAAAAAEQLGNHELVERLSALSMLERRALVDALERRLTALDNGAADSDELFVDVGLVGLSWGRVTPT